MFCSSFLQSAKAAVTPPARDSGNTLDKFGLFKMRLQIQGEVTGVPRSLSDLFSNTGSDVSPGGKACRRTNT